VSRTIRVAELIEQLKMAPQDFPVILEGCDCHGPCDGVTIQQFGGKNSVLLRRNDQAEDYYDVM
jgi:hypothetical protein